MSQNQQLYPESKIVGFAIDGFVQVLPIDPQGDVGSTENAQQCVQQWRTVVLVHWNCTAEGVILRALGSRVLSVSGCASIPA